MGVIVESDEEVAPTSSSHVTADHDSPPWARPNCGWVSRAQCDSPAIVGRPAWAMTGWLSRGFCVNCQRTHLSG